MSCDPAIPTHDFTSDGVTTRIIPSMGFGKAAFNNGARHLLSTQWRQTGILVNVYSVLRESLKL